MQPANPKYAIQISTEGRYEWRAVLADCTVKPPRGTTIMEKSVHALMAKVLVAITLREQGEEQRAEVGKDARTLRGWMNYFEHSIGATFPNLDRWVRGRLRTILRKRHKGQPQQASE